MKVVLDGSGYITSYALAGDLVDSIEVPQPEDLEHFQRNFSAYCIRDGNLVFDEAQEQANEAAFAAEELRQRREQECFPIINRGQLWYKGLTTKQKAELSTWYQDWLNVTETKVVPTLPAWL